jgi:hypothetical protein
MDGVSEKGEGISRNCVPSINDNAKLNSNYIHNICATYPPDPNMTVHAFA